MADVYKRRRLRVAIYCRISLARHGDQVKVERQEADCRALCSRLGWDVAFVFVDNNKSAWRHDRKRPGWDAMLETVESGKVDAIVIYHGDRLIRQPWDLELLLRKADEKQLRLASPTGTRNLDNSDDRFVLRIEAAQACRESDNISRRTKRGQEARVAAGRPALGGTRAFGYNRDMTIREDEAAIVREATARMLAGESMTSLVREFAERGVVTPTGVAWTRTSFRRMLARPKSAGLVSYYGSIVKPGTWEPIVEREMWEALQEVIRVRASARPQRNAHRYLLSGIAACAGCGAGLTGQHTKRGFEIYRCLNADCTARVSRNRELLDEHVIAYALERLADPRLWVRVAGARRADGAVAELEALQARKHQVTIEFADDDEMDPLLLRGMLRRLDERIAQVRLRIAARQATGVLADYQGMSRPGWDALPLERRRAIVRELCVLRVARAPRGRGFDEASVALRRAGEE